MTVTCALERLLEGHAISFRLCKIQEVFPYFAVYYKQGSVFSLVISLVLQNVFQNYHILVAGTARVIFYLVSVEPFEYKCQWCFINFHFLSYSLWISAIEEYQVWSVLLKSFRQHPANTHAERPRVLSLHNTFSLELPPFFHAYVFFTRQNSLSIKLLVSKKYTAIEAHIHLQIVFFFDLWNERGANWKFADCGWDL